MKKSALISLFSVICVVLTAQDTDVRELNSEAQVDTRPQFRGTLRTKYEYSFNDNLGRFNVRNARISASGNANSWISYALQIDLNDEGRFQILDADVQLTPIKNLTLRFGQTFLPFIPRHIITPGTMIFANRSLIHKYMSGASRDVGLIANYQFLTDDFPINLSAALFNGAGTNNPRWTDHKGCAFRLMFGSMDNFQTSLRTSYFTDRDQVKNELYAADLCYFNDNFSDGFTFEAEILRGTYRAFDQTLQKLGYNLQVSNVFKTENQLLKYLEPVARWDMMGEINHNDISDANRLTVGLNLGFHQVVRRTELRLNYERYFVDKNDVEFYFGPESFAWHDKITLELLLNF